MFDYLEAEAYNLLRYEISRIADEIFSKENVENTDFYNGQKSALNLIIHRMNSVQTALNKVLEKEVKRLEQAEKENV